MRYLLILACAFGVSAAVPLTAQTINPYLRLTDPLAIARLDEPDFAPLRYDANEWAGGTGGDSMYPGYSIVAQDTGAGIITHLFVITRTPDSLTGYKLIVDGQILRSATDSQFYLKPSGFFHSPLDTIIGEARLGDVQIPYRNGFELLFKSTGYYWSDYGWRPLQVSDALPDASLNSNVLSEEESQAAAVYKNPSLLWQGTSGRDTALSANI